MTNTIFNIPNKIKVGLQERNGTYTGKLAYVTYINSKGEIAKLRSWEGWRDKKISPLDLDNEPTEGFVLNKKAGGENSGWNHRNTYARVYDPRGFEFEITIENLLFILEECVSNKGKGLEGKFVYAWYGKDLILLPVNSNEYKKSISFKDSKENISFKNLLKGNFYKITGYKDELCYLGKIDWRKLVYCNESLTASYKSVVKKIHTFIDINDSIVYGITNAKKIHSLTNTCKISDIEIEDYIDKFSKTISGDISDIVKLTVDKEEIIDEDEIYFSYFNMLCQNMNEVYCLDLYVSLKIGNDTIYNYRKNNVDNNITLKEFIKKCTHKDYIINNIYKYYIENGNTIVKTNSLLKHYQYYSRSKEAKKECEKMLNVQDIDDMVFSNIGTYNFKLCGVSKNGNSFPIVTSYKFNSYLTQKI